jgi:hypothetical protein
MKEWLENVGTRILAMFIVAGVFAIAGGVLTAAGKGFSIAGKSFAARRQRIDRPKKTMSKHDPVMISMYIGAFAFLVTDLLYPEQHLARHASLLKAFVWFFWTLSPFVVGYGVFFIALWVVLWFQRFRQGSGETPYPTRN